MGDGNNGEATLTINIQATVRTAAVRVVGFVNKGNVARADSESSVTPWDFTATYVMGGSTAGSSRSVIPFPVGTEITLVADEGTFPGLTLNTAVNLNLSDTSFFPSLPAQFVRWEGDTTGASTGSDKGVLYLILDGDRTIDAVFTDMNALRIGVVGGADGGGTVLDIDVMSLPLSIPPVQPGNTRGANIVGTILTGQSGEIGVFGFYNDGTVITFRVPADWPFTSWNGDGAISGRSITMIFGQGTNATLTFP